MESLAVVLVGRKPQRASPPSSAAREAVAAREAKRKKAKKGAA